MLQQPGQFAWQMFDAKVSTLLRDEYRIKVMTKVSAEHARRARAKLEGVIPRGFLKTVREYNAAVRRTSRSITMIKDGKCTAASSRRSRTGRRRSTRRLTRLLDDVRHHVHVRRLAHRQGNRPGASTSTSHPIPGLYTAGEMVGGLFYFNYPSGTGLVSGAVFGRLAGRGAALAAKQA